MVDSIKPTHPSIPASTTRRDQSTQSVETHSDEKQARQQIPVRPKVERRKNPDRRNNEGKIPRAIYEQRSGRDRRKNNPGQPSIEIEV